MASTGIAGTFTDTEVPGWVPFKFGAYLTSAANAGNGSFAIIPYDTEEFDTGNNFDSTVTKGTFTAPVNGFYFFTATANGFNGAGGVALISLFKNGSEFKRGTQLSIASVTLGVTVSGLLKLVAGDTVDARSQASGAYALSTGAVQTVFQGFLVSYY